MLKAVITLFVVISLSLIALHTVFSWVPRNLQSIDGRTAAEDGKAVDLKARLEQALEQGYEVTITEEELNQYIASRLKLTQSSIVDDYIQITGVYVDLQPDIIDITIEREIDYKNNLQEDGSKQVSFFPLTQTVSLQLKVVVNELADGGVSTSVDFPGGNFGQSPAPGGLIRVIKPSFDVIHDFFDEELRLAYNVKTSVSVEDGLIKIDPTPLAHK